MNEMVVIATPITFLYAGILGLLLVALAIQVLYARVNQAKVPDWKPETTFRVQANFCEYVPMALILLYLVEVSGVPGWAVHALGATLVISRLAHAWGLSTNPGATYARLFGAQMTFLLLSIMSITGLYYYLVPRF
ncbi:MAG: MAPEG family protein [Alphaproteobacteria bacterium]|nr:MAPEG family protein [Alphaproteobacteria bacterium]